MKAIQNYSINVVILENFNDIVPAKTRSKVIEALMIQYMLEEENPPPQDHDATQDSIP